LPGYQYNKFTQVLYPMNNKSIFSLISFFLLSMFYVASANAGPTYISLYVPLKCGTWKVVGHQHCPAKGKASGKAGSTAYMRCVGGGNGKSTATISSSCSEVTLATDNSNGHSARATRGNVSLVETNGDNTFHFWITTWPAGPCGDYFQPPCRAGVFK
jgi:hypothetical protein